MNKLFFRFFLLGLDFRLLDFHLDNFQTDQLGNLGGLQNEAGGIALNGQNLAGEQAVQLVELTLTGAEGLGEDTVGDGHGVLIPLKGLT